MSTQFQRLERIRAENPKLSVCIDALSDYLSQLSLPGPKEVEPFLAAQALHITEARALGLLKLFEDAGVVRHSYNVYCGKQRTFLASAAEKADIPASIYCKFCDAAHRRPDDFEVELVFVVEDFTGKPMPDNVAIQ